MKKIMFSDKYNLTEAVLKGRKTQTRRIATSEDETPKYRIGEIVAIAQSYKDAGVQLLPEEDEEFGCHDFPAEQTHGWYNKMFVRADLMPHQIRITNVRVERLQDISYEDCLQEGVGVSTAENNVGHPFKVPFEYYIGEDKPECRYAIPKEAYAALIDKISGKGTWESNPYVFVYDFELVK